MNEFDQAYANALTQGGEDAVDAAASALAATGAAWHAVGRRTADRVVRECVARGWTAPDLVRMASRELTPRHERLAAGLIGESRQADGEADSGKAEGRTPGSGKADRGTPGSGTGTDGGGRADDGTGGSGTADGRTGSDRRTGGNAGGRADGRRRGGSGRAGGGRPGGAGRGAGGPDDDAVGDGGGLAGFAAAERLDRFPAATVLVELLCLYGRLPRVTTDVAPVRPAAGGTSKVLGRIRALLAKAESTSFAQEAEALSAKAQQLMARHSIDEALLGPGAGGDTPGTRRIGVDRPYEGAKALLLDAVASANRCEAVWSSEFGFSTVVGHEADLAAVELLYTSLLVQADRALAQGPSRRRDFRESFMIAYAARIRDRLTAAAEEAVAAHGDADALLPALAARDVAVRDATQRLFPRTTTSRLKGRDADGWREGESAADRAGLRAPAAAKPAGRNRRKG